LLTRLLLALLLLASAAWAEPDIVITLRDQSNFAILKPDGTVVRTGLPAGSVDAKGRVVVNEVYVGDVKPDGKLVTAGGKEFGHVDAQGNITFRGHVFIRISNKGSISRMLDAKHAVAWGKYAPAKYGFTRLQHLAAVVMFFQEGLHLEE
jgi:hypothetical protein